MRGTTTETCGCVSNALRWIELCATHEAERAERWREASLDSLQWLINHYKRFPNEDNLRHVCERLAQVGTAAKSRPTIVQWILSNATAIKQAAQRAKSV